jgi:formylglycine-generating enzyme required for sulfatase activity
MLILRRIVAGFGFLLTLPVLTLGLSFLSSWARVSFGHSYYVRFDYGHEAATWLIWGGLTALCLIGAALRKKFGGVRLLLLGWALLLLSYVAIPGHSTPMGRAFSGTFAQLRSVRDALENSTAPTSQAELEAILALGGPKTVAVSPFVRDGAPLPSRVVYVGNAHGPVLAPPAGVAPGTVFCAINPALNHYWLTATGLDKEFGGAVVMQSSWESPEKGAAVLEGNLSPPAPPSKLARLLTTGVEALQTGSTKVNPKDGLTYVWIPAGTFQMGCSPGDRECYSDERPAHTVTITKGFWMGQTEVTQAAYQRVMGANPSHFRGERLPVEQVTWDEANTYCRAVGMRLPTEAEWEYAARAGSTSERYGELEAIAWYDQEPSFLTWNSGGQTHEVAQKQPNAWKLYDMLGNVEEWVADWGDGNYYRQSPLQDPPGPSAGEARSLRGGSWHHIAGGVRVSVRYSDVPGGRMNYDGFRCGGG